MLYAHKSITRSASKDHQYSDRLLLNPNPSSLENQILSHVPSLKSFSLPSIIIPSTMNKFSNMRTNENITSRYLSVPGLRDSPSSEHRSLATPSTTATSVSYESPSPYSDHYLSEFPRILTSGSPNFAFNNVNDGDDLLNKLEISGKVPSKDKFRRMACMTFICTGACPYNERCVFLHDARLRCGHANGKTRPTRQPAKQSTLIKDTFYWPDMMRGTICNQLDPYGLPDVNQMYVVPDSFALAHASMHNKAIFSLWAHFSEFCSLNCMTGNTGNNARMDSPWSEQPFFTDCDQSQSRYLHEAHRLPVFVLLSCSSLLLGRTDEVRLPDLSRVVGSGRDGPETTRPSPMSLERDYSHNQGNSFARCDGVGISSVSLGSSSDSADGGQSLFASGVTSKDSFSSSSSDSHHRHHNNINHSHYHPFFSPMFSAGSISQDAMNERSSHSSRGRPCDRLSPRPTETNGDRFRSDAAALFAPGSSSISLSPIECAALSSSSWLSSPCEMVFADMNSPGYEPAGLHGRQEKAAAESWSLEKIMADLDQLWAPTEDDTFTHL